MCQMGAFAQHDLETGIARPGSIGAFIERQRCARFHHQQQAQMAGATAFQHQRLGDRQAGGHAQSQAAFGKGQRSFADRIAGPTTELQRTEMRRRPGLGVGKVAIVHAFWQPAQQPSIGGGFAQPGFAQRRFEVGIFPFLDPAGGKAMALKDGARFGATFGNRCHAGSLTNWS